jgi:predicted dehydrogenase
VNLSTQSTSNANYFVVENRFYPLDNPISLKDIMHSRAFNQFTSGMAAKFKQNEPISLPVKSDLQAPESTYEKGVFLYGLGDYSRVYIAPNIKREPKIYCIDYNYNLAKFYSKKFKYKNFGLTPEESYNHLLSTKKPLAIIATYHSDHTRIAEEVFNINKESLIFIEKPACVTLEDIKKLTNLYDKGAKIEIGYNRRYIPVNQKIRKLYHKKQKVINISVKEILINKNHWYFWENQGTRITGNLTHWIDLCAFWINGTPVEVNLLKSNSEDETLAIAILFSEGSLANITVSDKGNSLRGVQEHIEIRTKEETFVVEDYIKYTHVKKSGKKIIRHKINRLKGHDIMYKHLTDIYNNKAKIKYTKEDMKITATTTFYISKMYKEGIKNLSLKEVS